MTLYRVQPGRVYDPQDGGPVIREGAVVELDPSVAAPWVARGVLVPRHPFYRTRVMQPEYRSRLNLCQDAQRWPCF